MMEPMTNRNSRPKNQNIEKLRQAADQGPARVQYILGRRYDLGKDDREAVKWYLKAADQGYAKAQFNLGVKYAQGKGVPEDDSEAVKWYRLAAEQGHASAQLNLGYMYAQGKGVPEDDSEAVKWYRLAAEKDTPRLSSTLATCTPRARACRRMTARP